MFCDGVQHNGFKYSKISKANFDKTAATYIYWKH